MNVKACQQTEKIITQNIKKYTKEKVVKAIEREMNYAKSYMTHNELKGFSAVLNLQKQTNHSVRLKQKILQTIKRAL